MPDTNLKDDAVVNRAINADDILFAADPDSTTDADAFASDTVTEFLANLVERAIDPHLTLDQVDEDTTIDPNTPRRDRIILHWTDKDGDDLTSALEVREFIEAIVEMTYDVKNIIALTLDEATATIAVEFTDGAGDTITRTLVLDSLFRRHRGNKTITVAAYTLDQVEDPGFLIVGDGTENQVVTIVSSNHADHHFFEFERGGSPNLQVTAGTGVTLELPGDRIAAARAEHSGHVPSSGVRVRHRVAVV